MGFGFATNSLVGNALGAGNMKRAKMFAKVSAALISFIATVTGILMMALRYQISYLYI